MTRHFIIEPLRDHLDEIVDAAPGDVLHVSALDADQMVVMARPAEAIAQSFPIDGNTADDSQLLKANERAVDGCAARTGCVAMDLFG